MTIWTIRANYDPEAHVWYTVEGDMPGLLTNAETLEQLAERAGAMLPDLLDIHDDRFEDKSVLRGPHRIRVLAFHEYEFDVAA